VLGLNLVRFALSLSMIQISNGFSNTQEKTLSDHEISLTLCFV